jgi:hypothetical protein
MVNRLSRNTEQFLHAVRLACIKVNFKDTMSYLTDVLSHGYYQNFVSDYWVWPKIFSLQPAAPEQ